MGVSKFDPEDDEWYPDTPL